MKWKETKQWSERRRNNEVKGETKQWSERMFYYYVLVDFPSVLGVAAPESAASILECDLDSTFMPDSEN